MALASESKDLPSMTSPKRENKSWYKNFLYDKGGDSADVRNSLLVVVALIATVTFQAGVNPPGGVWQDNGNGTAGSKVRAGKAIYASQPQEFYVFLISNTIALCTSILVIISLTPGFPFYLEIVTATLSMLVTYASAITAVTPRDDDVKFRYVLTAGALPFIVRVLIHLFEKYTNKTQGKKPGKTEEKTPGNNMGDGNGTDNV